MAGNRNARRNPMQTPHRKASVSHKVQTQNLLAVLSNPPMVHQWPWQSNYVQFLFTQTLSTTRVPPIRKGRKTWFAMVGVLTCVFCPEPILTPLGISGVLLNANCTPGPFTWHHCLTLLTLLWLSGQIPTSRSQSLMKHLPLRAGLILPATSDYI